MTPRSRTPASHVAAIALAAALYGATLPFSIMHLDLARDIAHALAIVRGDRFPLEGPVLASSVHAGPIWYYLLAIPIAVWPAWLAVALFVGLLGALKFPLAYAAGTRLVDRRTGLIWALLLLYPGWMTLESVVQNHAALVATATLAVLVAVLGYLETGSRRALAVSGLLFGLALHAHPSTVGIGVLLLAAVAWRARGARASWLGDAAIVAGGAAIPFVPFLWSQATSGFPDFARATAFVGDPASVGSMTALPAVLAATLVGGGRVVAGDFLSRVPGASAFVLAATTLLLIAGTCGIAAALRGRTQRATMIAGLAAVLVLAATVAMLRSVTPFYMTFVVWTIAAGVLAAGLRACQRLPIARWVAAGALALALVLAVATQAGVADTLRRGAYPFAFFPLFDVKAPRQPTAPMPFVFARAGRTSGELLCSEPVTAAHGSYAVHLFHAYGLEAHFRCGSSNGITLGGADGVHRAGVSRTIARELGFAAVDRVGPLMLLPVGSVVNPRTGAPLPAPGAYPPAVPRFEAPALHVLDFEAPQDEAVLVTDLYFAFVAPPAVTATANGAAVAPAARDRVTTAFACQRCATGAPVRWQLSISTPALERVEVITARSAEPVR